MEILLSYFDPLASSGQAKLSYDNKKANGNIKMAEPFPVSP